MQHKLTKDQRSGLKNKFITNVKVIQAILKQYNYKKQLSHEQNVRVLVSCLESVLSCECLSDFERYLCYEDHIPIEISFQNLKVEQLKNLFDEWVEGRKQQSQSFQLDRVYTISYRNQLLKRVILESKNTIDDFFATLSSKNKLKGFDLFQLVTELLSPYFLYQYNHDAETFFEKVNSFESFMKIVEEFVHDGRRIIVKDKETPQDEEYIRKYQFEKLIQFWQKTNPQLSLQNSKRVNHRNFGIQTEIEVEKIDNSAQTEKKITATNSPTLMETINQTIHFLNIGVEREDDPIILESIQRMHDCIRKEKYFLAKFQQKNQSSQIRNSHYSFKVPMNDVMESQKFYRNRNQSPSLLTRKPAHLMHRLTPPKRSQSPHFKTEKLIKQIYTKITGYEGFNLNKLQFFFYNLGLVEIYQDFLLCNLIEQNFITNTQNIQFNEFSSVIHELMKECPEVNNQTLQQYLDLTFKEVSPKDNKDSPFKSNKNSAGKKFLIGRGTDNLPSNLLGQKKGKKYRPVLSNTTYNMDSDEDSYI